MNRSRRAQLVAELSRLEQDEYDRVLAEVDGKRATETAGADCLRQLFAQKQSPLPAAMFGRREQSAQ